MGVSTIELIQPNPSQSLENHIEHCLQALAQSNVTALKPGSTLGKAMPGSPELASWHLQQWCLGGGFHALLIDMCKDVVSMPGDMGVAEDCFPRLMGKAWGEWLDTPLGKADGYMTRNAEKRVDHWKAVCETLLPADVQRQVAAAEAAEAAHREFAANPDFAELAVDLYALLGWCIQWRPHGVGVLWHRLATSTND